MKKIKDVKDYFLAEAMYQFDLSMKQALNYTNEELRKEAENMYDAFT